MAPRPWGEGLVIPAQAEDGLILGPMLAPGLAGSVLAAWFDVTDTDRLAGGRGLLPKSSRTARLAGRPWWGRDYVAGDVRAPQIVSDGKGGAVVNWVTLESYEGLPALRTRVQRVAMSGKQTFPAGNGLSVNNTLFSKQAGSVACVVEDGDIVVFWKQYDGWTAEEGLMAQRYSPQGLARWDDGGIYLEPMQDISIQLGPARTADNSALIFYVFNIYAIPDYQIFMGSVTLDETPVWNRRVLATGPDERGMIRVSETAAQGYSAAWLDTRSGDYDIYGKIGMQ